MLFSPSGHRIYVARDDAGLLVLDRFSGDELFEIDLPGPARALRGDTYGQWLLVRPAAGDSAWVVDVGSGRFTGSAKVEWDDDLPAVVPPETLLTRGAATSSRWISVPRIPRARESGRRCGGHLAAARLASGAGGRPRRGGRLGPARRGCGQREGRRLGLPAGEQLAEPGLGQRARPRRLQAAGLPASVLEPRRSDEAYRVVLGPYATREQAEETGRKIGMPSFVVTRAGSHRRASTPPSQDSRMKLTKLELSGFKSFADTVNLTFEEGVTAIVGPNGCGKSNVSDAVRWVLGEQSARLLRGGKMEDVIFQGSAARRPVNVTEVSLYLDNTDGDLPIAYREVVVTRRLSRSGQSDYLLNGAPVRLRDIQDLLRGTGLGSDAGVVIEAKMIDLLLSDRADERRSLFEEAAGIGLYRDRKHSTERRLEETAVDLQRVEDLIAEVQSQIRSLARQRGKAERHVKLTEEKFALQLTLARRLLDRLSEEAAGMEARFAELAEHIPAARQQLAERATSGGSLPVARSPPRRNAPRSPAGSALGAGRARQARRRSRARRRAARQRRRAPAARRRRAGPDGASRPAGR